MKRLLCIISGMNAGGAETFLMKMYRELDKSQFQMDFCVNIEDEGFYDKEILSLGGRIYRIPPKTKSFRSHKRCLQKIVLEGDYKYVMRITSNAAGFLDLMYAKKAGATRTIARSSNSSDGHSSIFNIVNSVCRLCFIKYVDVAIAPSDLAAEYTFGKIASKSDRITILRNGLNINQFRYDSIERMSVRNELGVDESCLIVGHIGRFAKQKNHIFLIEIFNELLKINENSILLLVGTGELEDLIKQKVSHYNLTNKVRFLGVRSDIPGLLSAMDVFVLPSLYEGMPNTVIEAETNGLRCIISDTITKEANVNGLVSYVPLNSAPNEWASTIAGARSNERYSAFKRMESAGYDITDVVNQFTKLTFGE